MNENEKPKASDLDRLIIALSQYANRPETKNEYYDRTQKTVKKLREKQAKREAVEKPAREKALANPFVTIPPDALLTLDDVKRIQPESAITTLSRTITDNLQRNKSTQSISKIRRTISKTAPDNGSLTFIACKAFAI